jgi:hypothetical protein
MPIVCDFASLGGSQSAKFDRRRAAKNASVAGYRLYAVNELPARQPRMSGPFLAVGAAYRPYFGTYAYTEIVVE